MAGDLLIGEMLRASAERFGNNPMISHGTTTLSYCDVDAMAERVALGLDERGIARGDRVIWWGDTSAEASALFFGLAHLGATFVPINPSFSADEASAVIRRADTAIVVNDDHHEGDVTLQELLTTPVQGRSLEELRGPDEDDTHIIYFTSGTTGLPKGVELSHRTDMLRSMAGGSGIKSASGAYVCMFPQFHMAGWSGGLGRWMRGGEVVYVDHGDPDSLLGAVERHRAQSLYCIPAVWRRILASEPARYDTSSLREADTGTSATTPELIAAIREAFPQTTTSIMYGSTEAGGVTQLAPEDVLRKPGSVGLPLPNVFVRLEEGQILAKSPFIMTGYFRDPETTESVLSGGWYHTGELGETDEDGYFRIVGRTRDVIRTGGETVSPVEVDLVIQRHPSIADCAVAGIPNEDWGEVVTAFVVLRDGTDISIDELRAFCGDQIASYKQPREIVVVKEIPRTPTTGQVQRRLLVDGQRSSA